MSNKHSRKILAHWNELNDLEDFLPIVESFKTLWGEEEFNNTLRQPEVAALPAMSSFLVNQLPEEAIPLFLGAQAIHPFSPKEGHLLEPLIKHACSRIKEDDLSTDGGDFVDDALIYFSPDLLNSILPFMVPALLPPKNKGVMGFLSLLASESFAPHRRTQEQFEKRLMSLVEYSSEFITEELWGNLGSTSQKIRSLSAKGIIQTMGKDPFGEASKIFASKTAAQRLTSIPLLIEFGKASVPILISGLKSEKTEKIQVAIENALFQLGADFTPITRPKDNSPEALLVFLQSYKKLKPVSAPWLDLARFKLIQTDGSLLREDVFTYFLSKQSKHKTIGAAPEILPVLELLDRDQNSDAAFTLLQQWLDSPQEAKDRWALTLAGLLGDNRIIPPLVSAIQPWCEASRHKLAEYAAEAIALLGTEEALMILDTLANRYRSKFKNIGKACTAAFKKAAEIRGVSEDELGDLVVPDLGFNSECQKEFDDGKIIAVLQPDFKITWLNPETEKETKSPPANLSAEGKEELKVLRKILREAVKGQTVRFEQMLVRQRRWPVARWQELFEEHPLLQSYASSLVWGIYDSNSDLLRTFRRYPNGILAHASGEMEDLEERDTEIGLVHPLDLAVETLAAWREHLGRFKVKPPFLQIDRPVETADPSHANRREILLTENVQMAYGTFNGRTNKRGWIRGSVIDAGGVYSYYKPFHGVGVEAILILEECWVGMDPMDTVTLDKALFAKIESVERGSYIYDDPSPDDPRVLTFGEVPDIVYSETIADLKALIEGQK